MWRYQQRPDAMRMSQIALRPFARLATTRTLRSPRLKRLFASRLQCGILSFNPDARYRRGGAETYKNVAVPDVYPMAVSAFEGPVDVRVRELTYCRPCSDGVSTLAADVHDEYHVPRDNIERTALSTPSVILPSVACGGLELTMVPVRTEFFPLTVVCSAHASPFPRKTHKSITDTRRSCKGSR